MNISRAPGRTRMRDISPGSHRSLTHRSHAGAMGRGTRRVLERVWRMGEDGTAASTWGFEEGDEIAPGRHVLQLLGGGRGHEAYLAWDDRLLGLVVVKILRPHRVEDAAARRQIASESDAYASLQHPVLPRCFGADLDGPRPHLVLEFLEGPRLSTLVRKQGRLAVEQVLPLALQLCSALHYMGGAGWVHLDVKPKNVVMGAPPRLIDLSIAGRFDGARWPPGPLGTDAYMAPEQCGVAGFGGIGPASDVWGLGVTVYEAIVGRLPFPPGREDGTVAGRFPQLDQDPVPLPKEIPPFLADPIMSCLQGTPGDRPSAQELASSLQPLVAALPTPSIVPRIRPRRRRSRG
jgi:serine/threonine protein kinase